MKNGITLKKSSKGISVHFCRNGRTLAVMTGYNTKQNAIKGIRALYAVLSNAEFQAPIGDYFKLNDEIPKGK